MPWLSIIMWIVGFLISKKSGASNAQAAVLATGVAAATYVLADPANPDNYFGVDSDTPVLGALTPGQPVPAGTGVNSTVLPSTPASSVGGFLSSLPSWAVPAAVGLGIGATTSKSTVLLWAVVGLTALLILK